MRLRNVKLTEVLILLGIVCILILISGCAENNLIGTWQLSKKHKEANHNCPNQITFTEDDQVIFFEPNSPHQGVFNPETGKYTEPDTPQNNIPPGFIRTEGTYKKTANNKYRFYFSLDQQFHPGSYDAHIDVKQQQMKMQSLLGTCQYIFKK